MMGNSTLRLMTSSWIETCASAIQPRGGLADLKLLSGMVLILTFPSQAFADEISKSTTATPIEQLTHKLFRIQAADGHPSMTLVSNLPNDPTKISPTTTGYGQDCTDNYASLNNPSAASISPDGKTLIALLECPAANDGAAESIVALFDSSNTDTPICFSHLDLMKKEGYFFWGSVRSIEVKRYPEGVHIVIPSFSGGDAGDSWDSFAFLHIDNHCHSTLLSSYYASMYHEVDDESDCSGESLAYNFVNDSIAHVKRSTITCSKAGEKSKLQNIKMIDMRMLMKNLKLRNIEP